MSVKLEDTPYTRQKVRVPDVDGAWLSQVQRLSPAPWAFAFVSFLCYNIGGHSHVYLGNSYITGGLLKASLVLTSS